MSAAIVLEYITTRIFSGLTDSDVFAVRVFSMTDQDWFGNVRSESFANKYIVRLSGVQLSNCPYAEELTLRDVLCKCPNLYFGSMNNCTHGGSLKSINMDSSLKARYLRGDTTGRRAAPNDEFNKGPATRLVHNATSFPLTPCAATSIADGREVYRSWLANIMTSYRALDEFDCIAFPRIAMKFGVFPKALKNVFELVAAVPERDNRAAISTIIPIESTNQRNGAYFSMYSVTNAGVYSLSITDHIGIHISNSPFSILISPGSVSAKVSIVKFINLVSFQGSPAGIEVGVGTQYSISILLRDSFANFLWGSATTPSIYLSDGYNCGSVDQCFPVAEVESQRQTVDFDYFNMVDYTDATYLASYALPRSGRYPLNVKLSTEHLAGSPFFMYVYAGEVSLSSTAITGLGINSCGAGLSCTFSVRRFIYCALVVTIVT